MARPARRVGPRLLAEVRPGLGPAAPRELRLPAAGRAQPAARLGRAADPRPRRAGALRGGDRTCSGASPGWRPASPRSPRRWSTASGTSAAGSSSTRLQPGGARPGGRDLGRAGAARPARPAGGDRPAAGRGAPARPEPLLAADPPAVGLGRRSRASSRTRPRLEAPLLARPDLDQRGLDALDRAAPAGLRGRGRGDGEAAGRRGAPRGPARVLRPVHRRGPRRPRLRLDQPDHGDGRAGPGVDVSGVVRLGVRRADRWPTTPRCGRSRSAAWSPATGVAATGAGWSSSASDDARRTP